MFLTINRAGVHDPRLGERSEGHRDRHPVDCIVDDFMPVQDLNRIGPDLTADFDSGDCIRILEVGRFAGLDYFGF